MFDQRVEVSAGHLKDHDAYCVRDSVTQAGEIAINCEENVKGVGSTSQQLSVLEPSPAGLLDRDCSNLDECPRKPTRDALINEKSAPPRSAHERPRAHRRPAR